MSTPFLSVIILLSAHASITGDNLILNGDFELGNVGFASQYAFSPGNLCHGCYDMVHDPHDSHPLAYSYGDHTSGVGLMLAANGVSSPDTVVWSQIVAVAPSTRHKFSFWLSAWGGNTDGDEFVDGGRARPLVLINSEPIVLHHVPNRLGRWEFASATWSSYDESSAEILIVNQELMLGGNDFALDDIGFAEIADSAGACCVNGGCIRVPPADCVSIGGVYAGGATTCDQVECASDGACCLGETCVPLTQSECFAVAGVFAGIGEPCMIVECPTVCVGDVLESGEVDFADLLVLLSNWGPCPE